MDPDQTAPIGAPCSGSTLFASILISSVMLGDYLQQRHFQMLFCLGALRVNLIEPTQSAHSLFIGQGFLFRGIIISSYRDIILQYSAVTVKILGAQWLSGRVLDSRPRGRGFEPHRRNCVVSLSKNINHSLVLVQPRKTRPFITERLLMGRKESRSVHIWTIVTLEGWHSHRYFRPRFAWL